MKFFPEQASFGASFVSRFTGLCVAAIFLGATARAETIHVFLIGGQSNADGRANITGATQPLPNVLASPQTDVPIYYGTSASTPTGGNYPFANTGTLSVLQPGQSYSSTQFGPELSFGRSMADYYEGLGESIALIKYGVGGTSLAVDWKAGGDATTTGDGGSYLNFQTIVTNGLAALQAANPGATLTISGMIWMQGESDAVAAYNAAYQSNLTTFISDIRQTYGADLPFVIGQLSTGQTNLSSTYLNVVRDAQASVASSNPLNGLVVTDSFAVGDDHLHFNRPGQVALGGAFATEMQRLVAVPEPASGAMFVIGLLVLVSGAAAMRARRSGV